MNSADLAHLALFAQRGGNAEAEAAAALAGMMTFFIIFFLIIFVIVYSVKCLILYLVYNAYLGCPPQFRLIEPWQVWLLLIPCFPYVWNFFVYQKIPESYRNYFNATGRYEHVDCGQQLGLWYSILICCTLLPIPYIGLFIGIAALVILIILIVKLYEVKRLAEQIGHAPEAAGGYVGDYGSGYKPIADPKNPYASPGDYGSPYRPS